MTGAAFPSPLTAALDSFTVPALPAGFADRLVALAEAGAESTMPELRKAPAKPRKASPWARAGRILGSTMAVGFVTAAAAAAGFFGEPVYVPVITEAFVEARIIEPATAKEPKRFAKLAEDPAAETATTAGPDANTSQTATTETGQAKTREMFRSLATDAEFRKLPRREKFKAIRKKAKQLVDSGEATPAEIRSTLRQARAARNARKSITPEMRAKRRAQIAKRKEAGRKRSAVNTKSVTPLNTPDATPLAKPTAVIERPTITAAPASDIQVPTRTPTTTAPTTPVPATEKPRTDIQPVSRDLAAEARRERLRAAARARQEIGPGPQHPAVRRPDIKRPAARRPMPRTRPVPQPRVNPRRPRPLQ